VRSGRKASRRFGGRLELFRKGSARMRKGRGRLPSLVGLEEAAQLVPTGASYGVLCLASYASELALIAAQPEHADVELAAWLEAALLAAAHCSDHDLAHGRLAIEIAFLGAAGWMPSVAGCSLCGHELDFAAAWPPFADAPLCLSCAPGGLGDIGPEALNALAILRSGQPAVAAMHELPRTQRTLLATRVTALLHDALPRQPRSGEALGQVIDALDEAG